MMLKVSFWKHVKKFWILLFYCFAIMFILWVLNYNDAGFLFSFIIAGFLIVPTLAVHLNHYEYCKDRVITLLDDVIKIEERDKDWIIDVHDITCITVYMSNARAVNMGFQAFPFESYFYCKIDTNSTDSIFLSCLFSDKLDTILEEKYPVPLLKEKKYYPMI